MGGVRGEWGLLGIMILHMFTIRNSSCEKVIFSQAFVCSSGGVMHGEGGICGEGGMHDEGGCVANGELGGVW